MSGRYGYDPEHPMGLDKHGRPEPTRQPRYGNRLYCLVWADHDLFKIGLGSGHNARALSAVQTITRYLQYEGVTPGSYIEWRAELPQLEGKAWGDGQRLEMVVATAVKRRLGAEAAVTLGLEWFTLKDLQLIPWKDELTVAMVEALRFSALAPQVEWIKYIRPPANNSAGASQRDAWRTMRNRGGQCAMKGCGSAVTDDAVRQGGFLYCSDAHATADLAQRAAEPRGE